MRLCGYFKDSDTLDNVYDYSDRVSFVFFVFNFKRGVGLWTLSIMCFLDFFSYVNCMFFFAEYVNCMFCWLLC